MNTSLNAPADVVIIGGGIIGCSIALRLAQARLQVLVLERDEPGREASAAAAGMLAPQGETSEMDPFTALGLESRAMYPAFVEEIEELGGGKAEYRSEGELLLAVSSEQMKDLDKVYTAQTAAGLPVERFRQKELGERAPGLSLEVGAGLFLAGDHAVNNVRLMESLIEAARRAGVRFIAHTEATGFEVSNGRITSVLAKSSASLSSAADPVPAGHFVVAAGCWSSALFEDLGLDLPVVPCKGELMELESSHPLPMVLRMGHHYLVPRGSNRIVAGTTSAYAGFDKRVTAEGVASIIEGVRRFAPWIGQASLTRAWAGLRPDTRDHWPILGPTGWPNLTLATGHFRNGILLAPVTAQLISEWVTTGKVPPAMVPYDVRRFSS